jgi:hypothetical protein
MKIELTNIYKYYSGRMVIDYPRKNFNFLCPNFYNIFEGSTNKIEKTDVIESNILAINSITQNDILSGADLVLGVKKIFHKIFKKISIKNVFNHTVLFSLFFYKIICGFSANINFFFLKNVLAEFFPRVIVSEMTKMTKIYKSSHFFAKYKIKIYDISPLFSFFLKEKKKKKIDYLLNKNFSNFLIPPTSKLSIEFKNIAFLVNCTSFTMESFVLKLLLFHQFLDEHFTFKIAKHSNFNCFEKSIECFFKKNFLNYFCMFDFLIILQSIESNDFYSKILVYKLFTIFQEYLKNTKISHPITASTIKKIKSFFFY